MYNRHVKFGLKIPNRWGKCQKIVLTHTVSTMQSNIALISFRYQRRTRDLSA